MQLLLYTDSDESSSYDAAIDQVAAGRFVFVDADASGEFDAGEPFAISDEAGLATLSLPGSGVWPVQTFDGGAGLYVSAGGPDAATIELAVAPPGEGDAPLWSSERVSFSVDEDGELPLSDDLILSRLRDPIDSAIELLVLSVPTLGRFELDGNQDRLFVPQANANGRDTIFVAARAGALWSKAIAVEVDIAPVDDLPTAVRLTFVADVPENVVNALVATYVVDDIDGGELDVRLTPADVFYAAGGEIRLRTGRELNFESGDSDGPTLTVGVSFHAGDQELLSVSEQLPISDRPDPIRGIDLAGSAAVGEFLPGARIGQLQLLDEDRGETYSWQVSDARFFVDEENSLRLKSKQYLSKREADFVSLVVTASGSKGGESFSELLTIEVVRRQPDFQNTPLNLDVNDDGNVTPLDVLAVINAINAGGARALAGPAPEGDYNFIDVNGDWAVTPLDVLIVINYLNSQRRGDASGNSTPTGYPNSTPTYQRIAGEGEPLSASPAADMPPAPTMRSAEPRTRSTLAADAVDFYWSAANAEERLARKR